MCIFSFWIKPDVMNTLDYLLSYVLRTKFIALFYNPILTLLSSCWWWWRILLQIYLDKKEAKPLNKLSNDYVRRICIILSLLYLLLLLDKWMVRFCCNNYNYPEEIYAMMMSLISYEWILYDLDHFVCIMRLSVIIRNYSL